MNDNTRLHPSLLAAARKPKPRSPRSSKRPRVQRFDAHLILPLAVSGCYLVAWVLGV